MQTLNVSYADYARHVQIYLSLLASRGVEIQMFISSARGSVFSHGTGSTLSSNMLRLTLGAITDSL